MANLYRKASLDKISSPEQLDRMIVITPPTYWAAFLGGALIIVVALIWSIFGNLPIKVEANGIILPNNASYFQTSEVSGFVSNVNVKLGDVVKEGDLLFTFDSSALQDEIDNLQSRRAKADSVTITSINDEVSSDVQELLNIKMQYKNAKNEYSINKDTLNSIESLISDKEDEVDDAKYAYEKAKDNFDYWTTYKQADAQQLNQAYGQNYASVSGTNEPVIMTKKIELEALKADPTATEAQISALEQQIEELQQEIVDAKNAYEKSKDALAEGVALQNKLQEKQTEYQSLVQELASLKQNALSQSLQTDSTNNSSYIAMASYKEQFNTAKNAILNSFDNEISQRQKLIDKNEVYAKSSGEIVELTIDEGFPVNQGNAVVTIRPLNSEEETNKIVCYVPIAQGRKIKDGMIAKIYPSTVNKQEYGHMEATVVSVDDYVATSLDLQKTLVNEGVINAFLSNGPVVGVTLDIRKDDNTNSGYYWSNKKGASLMIDDGTIISSDIIVENKKPITMLVPFLKEKFENFGERADSKGGK